MYDILQIANQFYLDWILLASAIGLIFMDYYFLVDWPAFVGYACFSLSTFLMMPLTILASAIIAIGFLIVLLILHVFVFSKFLTNAPGSINN